MASKAQGHAFYNPRDPCLKYRHINKISIILLRLERHFTFLCLLEYYILGPDWAPFYIVTIFLMTSKAQGVCLYFDYVFRISFIFPQTFLGSSVNKDCAILDWVFPIQNPKRVLSSQDKLFQVIILHYITAMPKGGTDKKKT